MATCSRLCDLISASLLPYIETRSPTLNRETEKDLLLALSLVSRKIEQLTNVTDCGSEQEMTVKLLSDHNCIHHMEQPFRGGHNCLANIVSALVSFLGFDSRFVQHLSGNILVLASRVLAEFGNNWVEYLHLLWTSLETFLSSIYTSTSSSSLVESTILADQSLVHCYPHTSFIELLRSRLVNTNLLMVAGLFRILRSILKSIKQDSSDLEGVFMDLGVSSLLKMPWDKLGASQILTSEGNSGKVARHLDVLLGSVIQLFCSLVEQEDPEDVRGCSLEQFPIYLKFTNLVPRLLFCFSKHLGHNNKHLSGYFRHKVLMLMVRLSYHNNWKSSCPALWLKLLKQYFKDLLYDRILESDAGHENSLDGSPFLACFVDEDNLPFPCIRSLQRQAIFLLFRCCFTLSSFSKETGQHCGCEVQTPSFYYGLPLCSEDCCRRGTTELFEWLQGSKVMKNFVDYEDDAKSCSSLALSFLRLYIEDDDMLLEMLLLLLDAPLFTLHLPSNTKDRSLEELNRDMNFHFSSIFNPIHLFHLFLLLLHYDHSVLIDYLISKDTGIHCVKYLLRCLRIICESWLIFVEFSISRTEMNQSCPKRSKIATTKEYRSKLGTIQTFIDARDCLLSLKRSVEDLHHKRLFPYNPKPLIKSLSRFQELCDQEERSKEVNPR